MTIADLLFQAGFWQWVGILLLALIISGMFTGLINYVRVESNKTKEDK